jgi:signal peptidase I
LFLVFGPLVLLYKYQRLAERFIMPTLIQPRKPWFAALMSFILPGLGQLYNGEINKAIWSFFAFSFIIIPWGAIVAMYLPDSWLIFGLVDATIGAIGIWLWATVDAWRKASKLAHYEPKSWQISGTYLAAIIVCGLIVLPLTYSYVRTHLVEPFYIPSGSMAPSVLTGDYVIADKRYNCPNCKHAVKRGDIAIFTYPNDRTFNYIKRIVALPGDEVVIKGKAISINGKALGSADGFEQWDDRKWAIQWDSKAGDTANEIKISVPAGQVFVLGDNRDATKDSRAFGTVPLQDVIGRARQVWFSKSTEGIRWQRLGKVLE